MAENNDPTLRNALDAVNTGRRWTLLGISALFFAVILLAGFFFAMLIPALQPPGDAPVRSEATVDISTATATIAVNRFVPLKVLWVTLVVQLFFTACGTIAIMLHTSRMTRAVLRAIESARST